jgi:hypothetical protein
MPYTPLDSQAMFSTAFLEGPLPWAIWTAILSTADQDGITSLSPLYLARAWRMPVEEIAKAWDIHTQPDPSSKNKEHEGRRLIETDNGRWLVVSHAQYRAQYTEDVRKARLRDAKRRQRAKSKGLNVACEKCNAWLETPTKGEGFCPDCSFPEEA